MLCKRMGVVGALGALLVLAPGCAKQSRKQVRPLPHLSSEMADQEQCGGDLNVRIRRLSDEETGSLFKGRGFNLLKKHNRLGRKNKKKNLRPVHVFLKNKGNRARNVYFTAVGTEIATSDQVFNSIKRNRVGDAVQGGSRWCLAPLGVAGCVLAGSAAYAIPLYGFSCFIMPIALVASPFFLGVVGASLLPAVIGGAIWNGCQSHVRNKTLKKEIISKVLDAPITILPGQRIEKLVFVAEGDTTWASQLVCEDEQSGSVLACNLSGVRSADKPDCCYA